MPNTTEAGPGGQPLCDRVASSSQFKDLMATKRIFILPAVVFFLVYYFLLPILVGYAPRLMSTKVWGNVNLAYFFALSQFFMAWTIAWLYVRASDRFDAIAKDIVESTLKDDGSEGER